MSDERVYRGYMEGQLKRALADIEIPDSYYEKAETAYNSICNDLTAQNCTLSVLGPEAMLQGSMRLGTAVKPIDENGSYDVDMVCNLRTLSKSDTTQAHVKKVVGDEVKKYAKRHGMTKPRTRERGAGRSNTSTTQTSTSISCRRLTTPLTTPTA